VWKYKEGITGSRTIRGNTFLGSAEGWEVGEGKKGRVPSSTKPTRNLTDDVEIQEKLGHAEKTTATFCASKPDERQRERMASCNAAYYQVWTSQRKVENLDVRISMLPLSSQMEGALDSTGRGKRKKGKRKLHYWWIPYGVADPSVKDYRGEKRA